MTKRRRPRLTLQSLEDRRCMAAALGMDVVEEPPIEQAQDEIAAEETTFQDDNTVLIITTNPIPGEGTTVFAGDHDIVHLQRLHRPASDASSPAYNPYVTVDYLEDQDSNGATDSFFAEAGRDTDGERGTRTNLSGFAIDHGPML